MPARYATKGFPSEELAEKHAVERAPVVLVLNQTGKVKWEVRTED